MDLRHSSQSHTIVGGIVLVLHPAAPLMAITFFLVNGVCFLAKITVGAGVLQCCLLHGCYDMADFCELP